MHSYAKRNNWTFHVHLYGNHANARDYYDLMNRNKRERDCINKKSVTKIYK